MSNFNSGSFTSSSMFFNQRDFFSGSTIYHGDGWATTTGPAGSSGLDRSIRHYTGFDNSSMAHLNSHFSDPLKGVDVSWPLSRNKTIFPSFPHGMQNILSTHITDIYNNINDIDNEFKSINNSESFDSKKTLPLIEESLAVLNENTNIINNDKNEIQEVETNVSILNSLVAYKDNLLVEVNNRERARKGKLNEVASKLRMENCLKLLDVSHRDYNPDLFQVIYQISATGLNYRRSKLQSMWDELIVYPAKALYEAKNAYIYTMDKIDELGNTIDDAIHDGQSSWIPPVIKQPLFAIRHPIAAWDIGNYSKDGTNITSTASRFADVGGSEIGRLDEPRHMGNQGSQVNAFRHTLWQATIAAKYGAKIARRAGDAHEFNPLADLSISQTETLKEADLIIDLLNNKIGRKLGVESNTASMNELALITLGEFYTNGLYVAVDNESGGYSIIKQKLSYEQYEYMKSTFENLDDNGNPF